MANSVKVGTTNDSKVAAVVNMLRHPNNKHKVLCVVEGEDDVTCYSKLSNVSIAKFYAAGGCLVIEYIMQKLNKRYANRILAIRDADFGRLNGQAPSNDNIFWTDYHDIELMLLDKGNAYNICQRYCIGKWSTNVFCEIQEELKSVSYVRWFSQKMHDEKGQVGICFDSTPICPDIYTATQPIELDAYWSHLMAKQEHEISFGVADVRFFISQNSSVDLLQLTNGHEVVSALWCKIKVHYTTNLSKKEFKREIQSGYSINTFKRTQLYQSITAWLTNNHLPLIWAA